jgi:hypothetical protein
MWLRLTQVVDGYPDVINEVNMDDVERIMKASAGATLQFVDGRSITVREGLESIAEFVGKVNK